MPTWTPAMERIEAAGIDCTYRQLDYWCRLGLLGDEHRTPRLRGGSHNRAFTSRDLELLYAIAEIRKISRTVDLDPVVEIVRARPVLPAGEVLVVRSDGTAWRGDHFCVDPAELDQAAVVIPLRSFAGMPAAGGPDPAVPAATAGSPSPTP